MKNRRAFTLIELLVVIAIVAILLGVLIPALKIAKEMGKRAVCLHNLHSLGLAWVLYAGDNDARIPNAKTARIQPVGAPAAQQFRMIWAPGTYHEEPTWVGWWDGDVSNTPAHQACMTLGSIYPYVDNIKAYRCPVGDRDEWRTEAIVDSMNGHTGFEPLGKVIRKAAELRNPGTRLVFIDEGYATTESWTIWPDRVQWWDGVPLRHGEGTCVAMADGSSEYWKWKDDRTVQFAKGLADPTASAQNNVDFDKLQVTVWGRSARAIRP